MFTSDSSISVSRIRRASNIPTAFVAHVQPGVKALIYYDPANLKRIEVRSFVVPEGEEERGSAEARLEELNRLRKDNVELRAQLTKYSQELVKMETQATVARDRVVTMENKGLAFFQAWEDQIKSISNPEIREQAQNRYNKRVKSYNKIVKAMTEARDLLVPFMSDLTDIKKLLDSELSRESVKSAKQLIIKAGWHGEDR